MLGPAKNEYASGATIGSNIEWRAWGNLDPLYGVASWTGRGRSGKNPWTDDEFYSLGLSDWLDYRTLWDQYGRDLTSCVEIGCGAGRLTRHLAHDFGELHAIDVSEAMLNYAKQRIVSPGVHFHITDGATIPVPDASATSLFSTLVFQHFDEPRHAALYFREIKRVLRVGGTMMIQLPVYDWPNMPWLYGSLYSLRHGLESRIARVARLLVSRGMIKPFMRSTHYSPRFLFDAMGSVGFGRQQITSIALSSNGAIQGCVLATRTE